MALPEKPITRVEHYLNRIAGQSGQIPDVPFTRVEHYLDYIARNGDGGGGGITIDPVPTEGSTNAVSSGGVYDSFHDLTASDVKVEASGDVTETGNPVEIETSFAQNASELSVALEPIQDLHGYDKPWSGGNGKNKLNFDRASTTLNGITFTSNGDGTITVNGTATANADYYVANNAELNATMSVGTSYIVSGCPQGGSANSYRQFFNGSIGTVIDDGEGVNITWTETSDANLRIRIYSGYTANNLVFKPMIRPATETDPTFEPYSNICPIYPGNGKNLLNLGLDLIKSYNTTGTWNGNNYVIHGITFSVETNNSGDIIKVTANGTSTNDSAILAIRFANTDNCIASGCVNGYAEGNAGIYGFCYDITNSSRLPDWDGNTSKNDTGNGVEIKGRANAINEYRCRVTNGVTATNAVFKPMIRLASISDPTFVPYQGTRIDRVGKNLLSFPYGVMGKTSNGIKYVANTDGTVIASGTATANSYVTLKSRTATEGNLLQKIVSTDPLIISGSPGIAGCKIITAVTRNNSAYIYGEETGNGLVITPAEEDVGKSLTFQLYIENGVTVDNVIFKPMIRLASVEDSTFEPYDFISLTLNLGRDVYGGTVDIVKGTLTIDKVKVKLADQTLMRRSTDTPNVYRFAFHPTLAIKTDMNLILTISNCLVGKPAYSSFSFPRTEYCVTSDASGNFINVFASDLQTLEDWQAFATENDVEICYKLATPQTYTLTPQLLALLKGYNRISGDGVITIGYQGKGESDVQTELDEHSEKLRSLDTLTSSIAPVETSTASANYAVGDYLMLDGSLCKVTSAIATGETITIGSNVTVTTVAAELLAIIAQM